MSDFNISQEKLQKLGNYLKMTRELKGYKTTQVELYTGLSRKELFMLENAQKKKPNPFYLKALSNFYRVDLGKLYKIIGYMDEESYVDEIENYKIDDEILKILELLDNDTQKKVLNEMIEKIEYLKFKNGNYEEVKDLIELVKNKIKEL